MDDYLSEKEQWEWVKAQVRENGPAVIVAVGLAVLLVFGWRWWQARLDNERLAAADKYMQMVHALDAGDRTQALVALGELEREHAGSPYTDQGKLLAARVYVDEGALDRAAGELASVAEHSQDQELALIARLRLARVQIAQGYNVVHIVGRIVKAIIRIRKPLLGVNHDARTMFEIGTPDKI